MAPKARQQGMAKAKAKSRAWPKAKATAKGKAAARRWRLQQLSVGNAHLDERRAAVRRLNDLAADVAPGLKKLKPKNLDSRLFAQNLRHLNRQCVSGEMRTRFKSIVLQWVAGRGKLPDGMTMAAADNNNGAVCGEDNDAEEEPAEDNPVVPRHKVLNTNFTLKSKAFMLTHNSREFTKATWQAYRCKARDLSRRYGAKAWAACFERSEHAAGNLHEVYHGHMYFYWSDEVGIHLENLDALSFLQVTPRVDRCVAPSSRFRSAALHGLWYVAVMKAGTVDSTTNFPAWKKYRPLAVWLTGLWDDHKLTHDQFLSLSAAFRSGHAKRKRDVLEAMRDEREIAVQEHVRQEQVALSTSDPLLEFRTFEEVNNFLEMHKKTSTRRRRPMLVILGPTNLGKSLLAAHVLELVGHEHGLSGYAEITVEADETLDFSEFDISKDAGVLLDGVGDSLILKRNREVLQGRPKLCKGGKSSTMMYAYPYTLCRRAVVATLDTSAKNLHLFSTDPWLSDKRNCLVLQLTSSVWTALATPQQQHIPQMTPQEQMTAWTVAELAVFLTAADLQGPAEYLQKQGVNGADFAALTCDTLVTDLRCTPFAAQKLLLVRDGFLGTRERHRQ